MNCMSFKYYHLMNGTRTHPVLRFCRFFTVNISSADLTPPLAADPHSNQITKLVINGQLPGHGPPKRQCNGARDTGVSLTTSTNIAAFN